MKITDELKKEAIIAEIQADNKDDVISEMAGRIAAIYPNINESQAVDVIMEREKLCSTALDAGVAIPHGKMSGISNFIIAFGRSIQGIDFESLDDKPTHLFVMILSPENSSGLHLKLLAKISKIFKIQEFRLKLMDAKTPQDIYDIIAEEDAKY